MGYAGYAPGHKVQIATTLQQLLKLIKSDATLATMEKLTRNSAQAPGEEKFRKIRLTNEKIAAVITNVDGAVEAKDALRETLGSTGLAGIPLLVLGNKSDLTGARGIPELVDALGLKDIVGREVRCFSISCKLGSNVDSVLQWLTKHAQKRRRERRETPTSS